MNRRLLMGCSFCLALPVWGAEVPVDEGAFLDDVPLVLTASRLAQSPLDAPAPVTVIDQEMIRASGFTEIHDLFRLVPGFLVADWPSGPPIVVNHGLGDANGRRLQVLVDGRSVYNPFDGKVDWSSLPFRVEDIERIEVVRGPNPATYGANAFEGVVNIITKSPRSERGTQLLARAGDMGTGELALRTGGSRGPLDWRLTVSRRDATNYRDLGIPNYDLGEKIRRDVVNGQATYQLTPQDDLRFQLGVTQGDDTVGTSIDNGNPTRAYRSSSHFFQAAWRRSTAPDAETSLQYYHFDSRERQPYTAYGSGGQPIPVDFDVDMQRDDLEFQQTLPLATGLQGVWGAGMRHDSVRSEHFLAGEGDVGGTQWQLFGNLRWKPAAKWTVNLGGMLEKHYFTDRMFSPRWAVNYALEPSHVLRVSGGRGYRAPTAFEERSREEYRYNGTVADVGYWSYQHLRPEQVDFTEAGYVGHFRDIGLRVDARLFWEEYTHYIDDQSCRLGGGSPPCAFPPPPGYAHIIGSTKAFYFLNSGDINVRGNEIQFDWRNAAVGRVVLSHTYNHIAAAANVDPDVPSSAPLNTTSLLWMRSFPAGFSASMGYYFVGPMKWLNDGDYQPPYRRVDLRLAKEFGKRGAGNEISLTLQNLGGPYSEFTAGDFVADRRSFITLRLGL